MHRIQYSSAQPSTACQTRTMALNSPIPPRTVARMFWGLQNLQGLDYRINMVKVKRINPILNSGLNVFVFFCSQVFARCWPYPFLASLSPGILYLWFPQTQLSVLRHETFSQHFLSDIRSCKSLLFEKRLVLANYKNDLCMALLIVYALQIMTAKTKPEAQPCKQKGRFGIHDQVPWQTSFKLVYRAYMIEKCLFLNRMQHLGNSNLKNSTSFFLFLSPFPHN